MAIGSRRVAGSPRSSRRARKLTLIRLFEELRKLGYAGGYDPVRRYARRWGKIHGVATARAYVPPSFNPGEAYQFDWSHEIVILSGVTATVKVATSGSDAVRAVLFARNPGDGIRRARPGFCLFKGACQRGIYDSGIYDNVKTA